MLLIFWLPLLSILTCNSKTNLGSLRKQGIGVSPIVQQNQEFSIQNEDFPALPGFKGAYIFFLAYHNFQQYYGYLNVRFASGGNADYTMDMHQKEQLHDNTMSMIQSQHFPVSLYSKNLLFTYLLRSSLILHFCFLQMSRSAGFNLGGSYSSYRPQQQQQQHAPAVSSSGVSFSSVNNQDLLHGSDIFPSSHSTYHSQV